MNKKIVVLLSCFFSTVTSDLLAQLPELPPVPTSTQPLVLNDKEKEATKLAQQWMNRDELPAIDDTGKVIYLYGATLPSIVCSPLNVCDVELQPREIVRDLHVGDSVRWKISPAMSGSGEHEITHLIIKPTDVGLSTTMVVTTDRRTYHMKLLSQQIDFVPRVSFNYPDELQQQWDTYHQTIAQKTNANTLQDTGELIHDLDFEYDIAGKAAWKPIRVYNNGVKTIIQMPKNISQTSAPALLVMSTSGNEQLVNYRVKDDRYIVDQLFHKAILIAGVGQDQERITITRR